MNNRGSEDILEAQNREYADRLANKTSYLKSLAFDMENEAKDHHKLLNGLDDEFDGTGNFLSNTLNRVNFMMNTGRSNRKIMCYVCAGVIFMMMFVYLALNKLLNSSN